MNDLKENGLILVACQAAAKAAARYLQVHDLDADDGQMKEVLKRHVKARLDEALADVKKTLDCGMGDVASQTFLASMVLAGIDAAKEVGRKPIPVGMN